MGSIDGIINGGVDGSLGEGVDGGVEDRVGDKFDDRIDGANYVYVLSLVIILNVCETQG